MQATLQYGTSLAGRLAEDLLKAWISGDPAKVNMELERSLSISVDSYDTSEEERRHLLKAVADRMRTCPDLLEPLASSSELDVCVSLLGHLVAPASAAN